MIDYAEGWYKWIPLIERAAGGLSRCMLDQAGGLSTAVWSCADKTPTLSLAERVAHRFQGLSLPDERAKTPFALCNIAETTALLEHTGFDNVDVQNVTATFEFSTPREFVAYRNDLSSRFAQAMVDQRKTEREAVFQTVLRAVEPFQDPEGRVRMDNHAYCLSATRS